MKKIITSVALSTLLLGGLTACGTANNDTTDPNAVETQNYGGNGNYNQLGTQNGMQNGTQNGTRNDFRRDREGPLTDMLTPDDRYGSTYNNRLGDNTRASRNNYNGMVRRDTGMSANNNNTINRGTTNSSFHDGRMTTNNFSNRGMTGNNLPGMVDRNGTLRRDGGFTGEGTHGNLNFNATGYDQNYDSRTAKRIANSVSKINGVRDARVVVRDNDIIVGVETTKDRTSVQREVEQRVKGLTTGKNVFVVTDANSVNRIRTLDDRLRNGTAFDEVGDMFTDIFNDLGDAARRPFQQAR